MDQITCEEFVELQVRVVAGDVRVGAIASFLCDADRHVVLTGDRGQGQLQRMRSSRSVERPPDPEGLLCCADRSR